MGKKLGKRTMTNAERQAKWRATHKGDIPTKSHIIAALRKKLANVEAKLVSLQRRKRQSVTAKSSKVHRSEGRVAK